MIPLVKELELARKRVVELELKAEEERLDVLASLPAFYGFEDVYEFEEAVREAVGKPRGRRPREGVASTDAETVKTPKAPLPSPTPAPAPVIAQGIAASRAAPATASAAATVPSAPSAVGNAPAAPDVNAAQPAAPTPVPAAKPLPTGTSLTDPTNFGQLPDASLLERGTLAEAAFRSRLNAATVFAQQVLHTSRVPAAVWREWRDFTRKAADALRGAPALSN